jgi:hypothetical protein
MNLIKKNMEDENQKNTENAKKFTNILILSRLLYLIFLFKKNNQLTPEQFLFYQLNGNSKCTKVFFDFCHENIPKKKIIILMELCYQILKHYLKDKKITIALDEAHYFEASEDFKDK